MRTEKQKSKSLFVAHAKKGCGFYFLIKKLRICLDLLQINAKKHSARYFVLFTLNVIPEAIALTIRHGIDSSFSQRTDTSFILDTTSLCLFENLSRVYKKSFPFSSENVWITPFLVVIAMVIMTLESE